MTTETNEVLAKMLQEQITPEMINPHFIKPEMIRPDMLTPESIDAELKRLKDLDHKARYAILARRFPIGSICKLAHANVAMTIAGYEPVYAVEDESVPHSKMADEGRVEWLICCSWYGPKKELQTATFKPGALRPAAICDLDGTLYEVVDGDRA